MMPTVIPSDLREASHLQVPTREGSPKLRILAIEYLPSTQVEVSITNHPCIILATSKIFSPLPIVSFLIWIFQMFSSTPAVDLTSHPRLYEHIKSVLKCNLLLNPDKQCPPDLSFHCHPQAVALGRFYSGFFKKEKEKENSSLEVSLQDSLLAIVLFEEVLLK